MTSTSTRSAQIAEARRIDTAIAAKWNEYYTALRPIDALQKEAAEAKKTIKRRSSYGRNFEGSPDHQYYLGKIEKAELTIANLFAAAEPIAEAARQMDRDLYTGWQRFYLVEHIHSSQWCSSFRPTTRVGWLPDVSGLTEAEAVAAHGAILCTICFPSAPVEYTSGPKLDPSLCTGSGQYHDTEHLTGRENAYSSPSGYCPDCGRWNTVTKTGLMRKHKVDDTRRHW